MTDDDEQFDPRNVEDDVIRNPCTCNGMAFICNRWVFTGECKCRRV